MALSANYQLPSRADLARHWVVLLFGAIGAVAIVTLVLAGYARIAVAFTAVSVILTLAAIRVRFAIVATLVFLFFLGDLRRLLIPVAGWSSTDPLLLVGPAIAIVLMGNAVLTGSTSADTPASRCMIVLMAIMILQVFNPRQGGLIVGIAGVMFQLIPLFWFWIGRTYGSKSFLNTLLFRVVLGLSGLALLFGVYQSVFGYLPYQLEWFRIAGYSALGNIERGLSPITFFASNTEHAIYVSIGVVLLWSFALFRNRTALLGIPVFLGALLITGVRGPVAKILAVMAGLWAVKGKTVRAWVTRGVFALVIAGAGLFWTLSGISQNLGDAPPRIQHRLQRQANEFVRAPTGKKDYSSASTHLGMLLHGYRLGLEYPLGKGLGVGTKAAMKFGTGGSTESDLSDSVFALGLPGGLAYHVLVLILAVTGFLYWKQERSPLAMAILGFMGITFFGWLSGGRYAVTPLLWFCLGALDQLYHQRGNVRHE